MSSVLSLPASVRIVVFMFLMASMGLLLVALGYAIMGRDNKLKIGYLTALFASVFTMIITRTPLVAGQNIAVANGFSLIVALPFALAIFMAIKHKDLLCVADAIWCVLNVAYFEIIPYYGYVSSALSVYMLVRSVLIVFESADSTKRVRGILAIKDALDSLDDGIIFLNYFDKIIYINEAMKRILGSLGVSSYDETGKIVTQIKTSGQQISEKMYLIKAGDAFFRFDFGDKQITANDVTTLEKLVHEEELANTTLNERNKLLNVRLDELINYQNEKELLSLKSHIHDNLAQQLSILHMFMLKDDKQDLKRIKDVLKDINLTPTEEINSLDDLIGTFALIGVNVHVDGNMPKDAKAYTLVYDAIKECTTNAIKHSFAKDVRVTLSDATVEIQNPIAIPSQVSFVTSDNAPLVDSSPIVFGNGLNGLRAEADSLGWTLCAKLTRDSFTLTLSAPIAKS